MSQVQVACPACNRPRWISPERARRIERGVVSANCRSCKGTTALVTAIPQDYSDAHVRWWVERYGGQLPTNVPALPYLARAGGRSALPAELGELVASLRSE